jgi:hypothetical protein
LLATPLVAREAVASVSDCGLELDAFAQPTRSVPKISPRAAAAEVAADLRRLERLLRPVRVDSPNPTIRWPNTAVGFDDLPQVVAEGRKLDSLEFRRPRRETRPAPAWGISLLLFFGSTALVSGLMLLVLANVLLHPAAWRWGFAVTIGGQGILMAGFAAMSLRLWRNSRRLNSQLETVDRRLLEVQSAMKPMTTTTAPITPNSLRSALHRFDRVASTPY